jgi:tetratricopeptide (TPR) repeat protein
VAGVVLVVGAAGGAYEVSKLPSAAERHQRDAAAAGLNGNYADAVRLLTLVLDADPNQPAVYFRRGRAYQLLGRHMDAIRDFERAGPDTDGKLAACLGYSYTRLADQPKAIRSYERAIQTGFANAAVYNNLAFCHLREVPKPAAAHKAATAALDLEPSMLAASYNRALACKSLWWEYQAPDVMTGINDIRRVIAGSLGSHKIFRTAVELCAAELHDRGNPADDPLHVEGAGYLRRVVELSTKPLALNYYADPRMKCVLTWAAQLPQHIPLDPSAGTNQDGPDTLLRLVDPLAGQPE